jgi:toxin-antitoxin system PIN domain toxin
VILIDVNVLVYAHREDAPRHLEYRRWFEALFRDRDAFGVNDHVLSGVLRIVTHPKIFAPPTPLQAALSFLRQVREQPGAVAVTPGPRHWEIFASLCEAAGATGNLVPDAYFAALAIESGCEWVTTDRDYSRFPGLRWRHPLAAH